MNDQTEFAAKYLSFYGHLAGDITSKSADPKMASVSLAVAVASFQNIAGLPATGELDAATMEKMHEPRCGNRDVEMLGFELARWRKNRLTYYVDRYVNGLSKTDQDDLLSLAWLSWEENADIKLTRVISSQGADIIISTGATRTDGFDGGGGTLAWAYLPSGDDRQLLMKFDLEESWVKGNPQGGILFLNVATHEFGHLLGLTHSQKSTALMAPFYSPKIVKPQDVDDIPRIRAYYGPAVGSPPSPPPPPTPPPPTPVPGEKTITLKITGQITGVSIPGFTIKPDNATPRIFSMDTFKTLLALAQAIRARDWRTIITIVADLLKAGADLIPVSPAAVTDGEDLDTLATRLEAVANAPAGTQGAIDWTFLAPILFDLIRRFIFERR